MTLELNRPLGEKIYDMVIKNRVKESVKEGLESFDLANEFGSWNPQVFKGGPSLLYQAVMYNARDVISFLSKKIDVGAHREENGNTLLFACFETAAQLKYPFGIIDKIILQGVDINAQNNVGETALFHLVYNRKFMSLVDFIDLVRLMRKYGADKTILSHAEHLAAEPLKGTRFEPIYNMVWECSEKNLSNFYQL